MKTNLNIWQLYSEKDVKKVKHDHPVIKLLSDKSLKNLVQIYYEHKWKI